MASDRLSEIREFVREVDGDLQRTFPFVVEEVRDSGAGEGQYTVRGHAAVFDKWSLDLGGFRERVMPGAFDEVLSRNPHVLHLWDHDTQRVLSSTRNKTLDLRVDPIGLHYWSRVAPTTYANDLRILLERGDIDQSSFAFTVEDDEWRIKEQDGETVIERDVVQVRDLYDVTTTAMGAYPTTDAALAVRSLLAGRSRPAEPVALWVPGTAATTSSVTNLVVARTTAAADAGPSDVAPDEVGDESVASERTGGEQSAEDRARELAELKARIKARHRAVRERAFGVKPRKDTDT